MTCREHFYFSGPLKSNIRQFIMEILLEIGKAIIYGDYLVTRHFCNGSELLASSYYKPVPTGILLCKVEGPVDITISL